MSNPYFTVILPIYNVKKYLKRCVESVLAQSFTDYEMILVDDGSTDGSKQICDYYAEKYNFIKVIHKANGGLSDARNTGFGKAEGKYVLWFDPDDWVERNTLSLIFSAVGNLEPDIVKFNYVRHDKGKIICLSNAESGLYTGTQIDDLIKLAFSTAGNYGLSACMHAYKREFLEKNGLSFISEREVGSEDFLFNIEVLLSAEKILILPDALYHYDLRRGSLTQRYNENLPEKYTKLFLMLKETLNKQAKGNRYMNYLYYFYIWILMYGTCLFNEYTINDTHSIKDGRRKVREYLADSELRTAIRVCDKSVFTIKQRILLFAMRFKIESIFYWLFVKKPKLKGKV